MSAALSVAAGHNPNATPAKRRWRTPPALFRSLDTRFGFGLDAAAEVGAGLCPAFIPPEMNTLSTAWRPICVPNADGQRVAFLNSPWGQRFGDFPGTIAFTRRAIDQAPTLDGVVLLLPTAADTRWWGELFDVAAEVLLLPRIAFIDPDTGVPAKSPPGGGCTVFTIWPSFRGGRRTLRADDLARPIGGMP